MPRAARKPKDDDSGAIATKDFALAVKLFRHDIKPAISKVGEHSQEVSTAYKAIKKSCHIQPQAAKLAFKLEGMEEAKRDDFLRCLTGLLGEFNIPLQPSDLVDQMAEQRPKPQLVTIPTGDGTDNDLADPSGVEPTSGTGAAAMAAMRAAEMGQRETDLGDQDAD